MALTMKARVVREIHLLRYFHEHEHAQNCCNAQLELIPNSVVLLVFIKFNCLLKKNFVFKALFL